MWGNVIAIGRCHRDIAASPRLRFSPLEVFPQRQFQPILPRIVFRWRSGSALAFMLVILHREPVCITGRMDRWAK
ncbi:MAG TPA: hypothetical protein VN065_10400, partial [Bradyrhizobium sp.]|nr:hypothetical protein [Bradyrhizobium sp.]